MEEHKAKKGTCNSCGIEYIKEVYEVRLDERFADYVYRSCPNCNYDPYNENSLRQAIHHNNFYATINSFGKISFNFDDLEKQVIDEFRRIWPKSKTDIKKGEKK